MFLENQILLNEYQFFTYQDYLQVCKILMEVGGSKFNKEIIYNPPLAENKFLSEKQKILKGMIDKDIFFPPLDGNTIFPDSSL